MTCLECKSEIRPDESYLHYASKKGSSYAHYCCAVAFLVYELNNNQMVFDIIGQKLTAGEVLKKTVPLSCPHDHPTAYYLNDTKKGNNG